MNWLMEEELYKHNQIFLSLLNIMGIRYAHLEYTITMLPLPYPKIRQVSTGI